MCGILGVFNLNKEKVKKGLIESMSEKLSHRGPDDSGYFVKDNIGLAHKRLAILDVSEKGNQPMSSKNNKWTIVFNGCIYNFKELRKELESKGHIFISNSDTEVICEGLDEFGVSFLSV